MSSTLSATDNTCRTLWLGDVQPHWDEEFIAALFPDEEGEIEVKLIRDKVTGYLSGYGFIEFLTHEAAAAALERYNGQLVEGTAVRYRLNWGAGGQRIESAPEYSIFVGDLTPEVTDVMLRQTFASVYQSVLGAKIVTDLATGASKGFGFVRFSNEEERDMAFAMQGNMCAGRPMRVAPATKRAPPPSTHQSPHYGQDDSRVTIDESGTIPGGDLTNTTVFVGGLSDAVTEDMLHSIFEAQGPILYVKIPPGRGCGFISFAERSSAEGALSELQGVDVGGCKVRLSWGKSQRERANAALGLSAMSDLTMSLAAGLDLNGGGPPSIGGLRAGPQWSKPGGLGGGELALDMYGGAAGGYPLGGMGGSQAALAQQQQAAYYAAYAQFLGYDIAQLQQQQAAQQQAAAAQQHYAALALSGSGGRVGSPGTQHGGVPESPMYLTSPYQHNVAYSMAPSPLQHQQQQQPSAFPYGNGGGGGGGGVSNGYSSVTNGGPPMSINVNNLAVDGQGGGYGYGGNRLSPVGTIGRAGPVAAAMRGPPRQQQQGGGSMRHNGGAPPRMSGGRGDARLAMGPTGGFAESDMQQHSMPQHTATA